MKISNELKKLHDFSLDLNSSLRIEDILQKGTKLVLEIIGGSLCHLLLTEELKLELGITEVIHFGSKSFPGHVNEKIGISALTLKTKLPVLIHDTLKDPRVTPALLEWFGHRSMLTAPIFVKEKVIGVIVIANDEANAYGENDVPMLMMYGNHLGLAVENARLIKKLEKAAITDGLTEIYNHTFFRNLLKEEISKLKTKKEDVSLIIIDINNFKGINDHFGHLTGDYILKNLSVLIKDALRPGDILARYGGDEFAIFLPRCCRDKAKGVADRITEILNNYTFEYREFRGRITVSIGIASYKLDGKSDADLIDAADKRMYANKTALK